MYLKLHLPADCRLNRSGSATSVHEVNTVAASPFLSKYTTLSWPQLSLLSTNSYSLLYWGINGWMILNVFLLLTQDVVDSLCEHRR
ncbi:MAG: hypothetical protein Q8N27_05935 [Candidatus Hydromicrobium sp.]|nr:hypothetical protein [Candidatus Hydromicrobium sp.]